MLARTIALIIKELISLWADKKTRFVMLIPPLIQVIVFANAANYDVWHVPLSVWNEDLGTQSAEYIRGFSYSPAFATAPDVFSPAQAQEVLESKTAAAVLHIPQTFSADMLAGRPSHVQLLIDARRSNTALLIGNYAAEITETYSHSLHPGIPPPVDIELTNLLNPELESQWFILPGLVAILALIMATLVSSLSLAREKELGTYEQMLVTPLRPAEIMLGKAVPSLIVGLVEGNIVLLAALILFQLPFKGNLLVLELCLAIFSLAGVGVGLAISAFTRTQQQAILGVFVFVAPAVMISGYATPVENMPPAMQLLSLLDPIRYMLVIARGMFLETLPASVVFAQSWPMALIAAVTLIGATFMVRRSIS
jgi:ABC-2 type transport system permease protein